MSRFSPSKHRADMAAFQPQGRAADVAAGRPISDDARFWLQHAPMLLQKYTKDGCRKPTGAAKTRGREGKNEEQPCE